jgi:hypothetical protein
MSRPVRDLAERYLGLVGKLLPATRSQWAQAMQAELATLDNPSERRRFALGCMRAALLPSTEARSAQMPFAAALTAALVFASIYASATAIGETVPLLLMLALLAWRGRRPGYFGPVQPDHAARTVRAGGYVLVASCLLVLIVAGGAGVLQPTRANWGPIFTVMLTLFTALFLALTARGTRFGSTGLGAGALGGIVAGIATFLVMPFEHGWTSLSDGLPWNGQWLWLLVLAAPAAAALHTAARTRRADHGAMAATIAVTFGALLVALLGYSAIVLFPGSLAAPPVMPGAGPAARLAEQQIGAADGYWGMFTLGMIMSATLWVMLRPFRVRTTYVLLTLLALPLAAFGLAVSEVAPWGTALLFGAAGLTLATAAIVAGEDGAAATARPARDSR